MKSSHLSGALFSTVQRRVLTLLFGQPDRSFYTSELVRLAQSGTGAVERELERLHRSGLVLLQKIGNQKHYRANPASPIFEELKGIVRKTSGLTEPLRQALAPFAEKITAAFVYGSIAKGSDTADSDIDLIVIGEDISYGDLFTSLQQVEFDVRRPINPTVLSDQDWRRKSAEDGSFIAKIAAQPKMFVIGSDTELPS